jgi:hypothetical protein
LRFPPVDVAKRRTERRAAFFGLAQKAFHDLLGQVARVELSEFGHDSVEEPAGRRVIDILATRDELDAVLTQQQVNGDVVFAVSG